MLIYEGARKGGKNITFTKQSVKELDQKISLIPLSYDIVFKGVFKRNLDLLKKFLNVTLPITIGKEDKVQIIDGELPVLNKNEHGEIVDILVVINKTIFVDIEMNRSKFENVVERNIEYKNRISNLIFEKGENIKQLKEKRLYQINLNANPSEEILEDVIVLYGTKTKKIYSPNDTIVKGLERYRDLYYNGVKDEDVIWLTILTARTFTELYELVSIVLEEDEVKRLMEMVVNMSMDEFTIHSWQKDKMDALVKYNELEEATNKGIAEGIKENQTQIVKNMLNMKMSLEDISKATGLTIQDIQELQKQS